MEILSKFRIRKENFGVKVFILIVFLLFDNFFLAFIGRFDFKFLIFIDLIFLLELCFLNFD